MRHLPFRWAATLLLLLPVFGATGAAQEDVAADAAHVIEALAAQPGSVIADIGAGPEGLLTLPLARLVGAGGRIYATELDAKALASLRQTVQKAELANIEIIEGDPSRTNLPPNCCDGILLRYVYHHFADPPVMNASLRQTLKPGGRLAIIEFPPDGPEAATPADRAGGKTHGVTAETVGRELQQAGFELVTSEKRSGGSFFFVVRKPLTVGVRKGRQRESGLPARQSLVSLSRIREALEQSKSLRILPLHPEADFRVVIRQNKPSDTVTDSSDFRGGPVPPGGLYAFEQRQRLGQQWSEPLIRVDLLAVTALLTTALAKAHRARAESAARTEVQRTFTNFCETYSCSHR
jgi:tRNA A58 N-methylase Trm61